MKIFEKEEFGQVRIALIEAKPYAVGNDIAEMLMYKRPYEAVAAHCKGAVDYRVPTNGGNQIMKVIPEGDIYRLIVKAADQSKNMDIKNKAEKFESWIFDEVLPAIRKTGGYVNDDELFLDTYFPFMEDEAKEVFRATLANLRVKNELIIKQQKAIEHKEDVIIGLVDKVDLAKKRQVLNRVVRYKNANFRERWAELYKQFEMKYHIDLNKRFASYNESNSPKMKNKLDYIDKVMGKIPELYEIACKLYENDVKELVKRIYKLSA